MGYLTLTWRSSSYLTGGWPRLQWGGILCWKIVDSVFGVLVVSHRPGSIWLSVSSKLVLSRVGSRETTSWSVSSTLVLSEIGSEGTSEESSRTYGEDWANWLGSEDTVLSKKELSIFRIGLLPAEWSSHDNLSSQYNFISEISNILTSWLCTSLSFPP